MPTGFSRAKMDWVGTAILSASLTLILVGLMFAMLPYGTSPLGWGNPLTWMSLMSGGILFTALFLIESRIAEPMLRVRLFRIRQFTYGTLSAFFLSIAQGANVFVLSMLLQAIYLPLHGIPYSDTPLWAGIYLVPSSIAGGIFGPIGGRLLNRLVQGQSPRWVHYCLASALSY